MKPRPVHSFGAFLRTTPALLYGASLVGLSTFAAIASAWDPSSPATLGCIVLGLAGLALFAIAAARETDALTAVRVIRLPIADPATEPLVAVASRRSR